VHSDYPPRANQNLAIGVRTYLGGGYRVQAVPGKDAKATTAGLFMLFALLAFAAKLHTDTLRPGEFLHIGLSICLLTIWRWSQQQIPKKPLAQAKEPQNPE